MDIPRERRFSRRAFAQRAALLSASATIVPAELFASRSTSADSLAQIPDNIPKLSPEGQVEAGARYQLAISRYGGRLTEEEKNSLKVACEQAQPGLERLRTFSLQNGDVPALYLKPLVERDKLAVTMQPTMASAIASKKS